MVDLFSGDFNYNIPLLDIDGYPVNISYHSGVNMDQEASWVGLGWNINAGVINRNMRGIPDDFSGDEIEKEFNMKPNVTYGVTGSFGAEVLGFERLGISYGLGISYNNYNGIGFEQTLNASLSSGDKSKSDLTAGLGITSSADGLTLNPSLSYDHKVTKAGKADRYLGASVGCSYNSRGGLKALTIGVSSEKSKEGFVRGNKYKDAEGNAVGTKAAGGGLGSNVDLGAQTYIPQVSMPMVNTSVTMSVKGGITLFGIDGTGNLTGYYSSQRLAQTSDKIPAFGYINSEKGAAYSKVTLDFNREKDGSFSDNTPSLPITSFTYDVYAVTGQGIGGTYRPYRSDMGSVFDSESGSTSDSYSLGAELAGGNLVKGGVDVKITDVYTSSGKWASMNQAADRLQFRDNTGDPFYEPAYFREAGEKSVDSDPDFFQKMGGGNPVRFKLADAGGLNARTTDKFVSAAGETTIPTENYRKKRQRRNQNISFVTRGDLNSYGVEVHPSLYPNAPAHHVAEVTALRPDGTRYVYGIAAYNTLQEETTFSVGQSSDGYYPYAGNCQSGLIKYNSGTNSTGNKWGLDNYFTSTKLPAYAHSYLLTSVLSPDYVDADNVRGPSDGDLGNYTHFTYSKVDKYGWRVPYNKDSATYNEGLRKDLTDDRANYLYGEKELWYLDRIETKNYIAIFTKSDRNDGYAAQDRNGGKSATPAKIRQLDKISLYARKDFLDNGPNAIPVKEVYFTYTYDLNKGLPNALNAGTGKLTLTKIAFSYGKSNKARLSPYTFTYCYGNLADANLNPSYNIKAYDRWGGFKPNPGGSGCAWSTPVNTSDFPYVDQDTSKVNKYAAAWALTKIDLPSGGSISVDYESDDYAYVQDRRAMQMFTINGITTSTPSSYPTSPTAVNISGSGNSWKYYFKLQTPIVNDAAGQAQFNSYFEGIDKMYFRFLMDFNGESDYVSGYTNITNKGLEASAGATATYAWIQVSNEGMDGLSVSPMVKAAVQFARLNLPRFAWNQPQITDDGITQFITALAGSSFAKNIAETIKGPNKTVYDNGYGKIAILNKSWIRLNNPNKHKLGGGARVKKIQTSDSWNFMAGGTSQTVSYGQQYEYTLDDGSSSGVAAYEPAIGGDENPFRQPVFIGSNANLLAPDDEHFVEEPFGESFFPSASVGYSRVTVKNLQYNNVRRHATGKVVHDFYTAKDFPTICTRTDLDIWHRESNPILDLFSIDVRDYMYATQGFTIELNDMHGKPKSQKVYAEIQSDPISSLEYRYQSVPYLKDSRRLTNQATVINPDGSVSSRDIGVEFDFVADMRAQSSDAVSPGANGNLANFLMGLFPLSLPTMLPSFSSEYTQFRSAATTKVISRSGLLIETVATDLGSMVATKNIAYDAETGEVLVNKTTNEFNDEIYTMNYPAHWYYDGMGPAYRNIGVSASGLAFNSSGVANVSGATDLFTPGDEIALKGNSQEKGWVSSVAPGNITVINKYGKPFVLGGSWSATVIRSGRRNMQATAMGRITSLVNPLDQLQSNVFGKITQANAIEYTDGWKTFCECFVKKNSGVINTTNPYIIGTKGFWKKKKEYLYLSQREQSNYNNNTNIRKDGVYLGFNPFWRVSNGTWGKDEAN